MAHARWRFRRGLRRRTGSPALAEVAHGARKEITTDATLRTSNSGSLRDAATSSCHSVISLNFIEGKMFRDTEREAMQLTSLVQRFTDTNVFQQLLGDDE